jgi:hypothetical protein
VAARHKHAGYGTVLTDLAGEREHVLFSIQCLSLRTFSHCVLEGPTTLGAVRVAVAAVGLQLCLGEELGKAELALFKAVSSSKVFSHTLPLLKVLRALGALNVHGLDVSMEIVVFREAPVTHCTLQNPMPKSQML